MIDVIEFLSDDYCMNCNEHSIELYDVRNKAIGYHNLLENPQYFEKVINTSELSHFQCKKCGASYGILWNRPEWDRCSPFREVSKLKNFEDNYLRRK
jgi:hypothetical protein